MTDRPNPYTRCKKSRELVIDADNCANCASRDPHGYSGRWNVGFGKRGSPTLDIQEGNSEESF